MVKKFLLSKISNKTKFGSWAATTFSLLDFLWCGIPCHEPKRGHRQGPKAGRRDFLRFLFRSFNCWFRWFLCQVCVGFNFSRHVATGGPTASRTCENRRVSGAGAAPNSDEPSVRVPVPGGGGCVRGLARGNLGNGENLLLK